MDATPRHRPWPLPHRPRKAGRGRGQIGPQVRAADRLDADGAPRPGIRRPVGHLEAQQLRADIGLREHLSEHLEQELGGAIAVPVTASADAAPRNATRVGGPGRSQNETRKAKNGESGARKLGTVPVRDSQNGRRNSAISLTMAPLRRPPMAALFRSGRSGRKAIAPD